MRVLPLSGLLDSVYFLLRCRNDGILSSIVARLDENNPDLIPPIPILPIGATHNKSLQHLDHFLDFFFDFKARVFPDIFILFAYAKLCTLNGIPVSLVLGSVYFFSWLIMEATLMAQRFRRRRLRLPELQQALAWPQRERHTVLLRNLRYLNRILIAIQITTGLIVAIVSVVRLARRGGQPASVHSTPGFSALLAWLFSPSRWAWNWSETFMNSMTNKAPHNPFLGLAYFFFVLLPCFYFVIFFEFCIFAFTLFVICMAIGLPIAALVGLCTSGILRMIFVVRNLRFVSFLLLGGSLLYYIGIYNPAGTSKRAWSDMLG